jgi:hypothetical protein
MSVPLNIHYDGSISPLRITSYRRTSAPAGMSEFFGPLLIKFKKLCRFFFTWSVGLLVTKNQTNLPWNVFTPW